MSLHISLVYAMHSVTLAQKVSVRALSNSIFLSSWGLPYAMRDCNRPVIVDLSPSQGNWEFPGIFVAWLESESTFLIQITLLLNVLI